VSLVICRSCFAAFVLASLGTLPERMWAQSLSDLAGLRYSADGTYEGKLRGDTSYVVQGDSVTKTIECSISMTFRADGMVTYDAGRYLYREIYSKRTASGGFVKRIAEIYSDGGQNQRGVSSRLSIWKTAMDLVHNATWSPRVEVPGTKRSEVWYTDHRGTVQQKQILGDTAVTVYCDAIVLWRTRTGTGPGLPLQGQLAGRDVRAGKTWIDMSVTWNFRPIARWRS
jgi:hypothetical protein